jgi:hypothetical protein
MKADGITTTFIANSKQSALLIASGVVLTAVHQL